MSDYMYMLESHLNAEQSRVLAAIQSAAADANINLFLTGGAMRDVLGGFPTRDLDFTVEGNAIKLAGAVAKASGARVAAVDEQRGDAELVFPGGVIAEISMSRVERYAKPGSRPQVAPATIHEDLRGRDFTINSIALSLNRASRGLLVDPNNGLADLERRELRTVTNYSLYDRPVRLLRLIRFRVRFGFTIEERAKLQYDNVREAKLETSIPPRSFFEELREIGNEANPADVLRALEEEKLTTLFSPALAGAKINYQGLGRLQKAKQMIPFGVDLHLENLGLFLTVLTEKFTPKEKAALAKSLAMRKSEVDLWQKLDQRSKKLERDLKSARLQKGSQIYAAVRNALGDETLHLFLHSSQRIVQDRIRNFLQKYLPAALEITDKEITAYTGVEPASPKFAKAREETVAARLDGRLKKPAPPPPPEVAAPTPASRRIVV